MESPITRNVLTALPEVPVQYIRSSELLLQESQRWTPRLTQAKRSLILARHKGAFFKPCPAGQAKQGNRNVCCNYFVINYASNCHMECSYCYLQTYLNFPHLVVYANLGELFQELQSIFSENPGQTFRVGTGELADSLALDPLTGYSVPLVEFFARQPNAVLEFKTKSDCIARLPGLKHNGRTVVSWSMNPDPIQRREEHRTATVCQRLTAAKRCAEAGYPVAFHLDPLISYEGWEKGYRSLLEDIFQQIPAESLSWISLGTLRLPAMLREVMRERFPRSRLPFGELVPTEDGKLRYFKPIRVEMYQTVLEWIRESRPDLPVYACMENRDVWSKVFGQIPAEKELGEEITRLVPLRS